MLDLVKGSHASRIIPLDIHDPSLVFYSPLWYPTSQAVGGVIESGTGTMAVTPLTLVVGATTVTATGAGTFFVTMPEGGVVASDGAVVTGSPVTILANTRTSVTLEGAGTFTCTVSDIFRSMDSNRHLMTNVGATWDKYGRILNGTSSKLTVTGTVTGIKAVMVWIKPDDKTTRSIVDFDGGTHSIEMDASGDITATGWTSPTRYVNGVAATAITQSAWNCVLVTTGTAFNGTTVILGQETSFYDGGIGEAQMYNLVPDSAMRLYQQTKWRYQS